jgi:hypothetical protein
MAHPAHLIETSRADADAKKQAVKLPQIIWYPPDIEAGIRQLFGPKATLTYQRGFGHVMTTTPHRRHQPRGLDTNGMRPADNDDMAVIENGVLIGGCYNPDDWSYIRQWIEWQKPKAIVIDGFWSQVDKKAA